MLTILGFLSSGYSRNESCKEVTADVCEHEFIQHVENFDLHFENGKEFSGRLDTFCVNYKKIVDHNCNNKNTYKFGLNQFSHLTLSEYKDKVHIGTTRPPPSSSDAGLISEALSGTTTPASIDWQVAGYVSPVKDQGNCGACYAFAANAALESGVAISLGITAAPSLSNQEIVSCCSTTNGCNGGWMTTVWSWIIANGGITLDTKYPYTSGDAGLSGNCLMNATKIPATVPNTFANVQKNSVPALTTAVALQPVAVGIEADSDTFQFYASGIIDDPGCGTNINHAVTIVGYGIDNGVAYWRGKNSWGTSWGEQGYVRILQSDTNTCGVLSGPCYPVF